MALYLLNQGEQVQLPTRPLLFRLQGGGVEQPRVVAFGSAEVPLTAPRAIPRPGGLLLPRIAEPIAVKLLPPLGHDLFPAHSIVTVSLGPDGGDPDADHAQLTFDVSGLPVADLAFVEPVGGQVRVTARGPRREPPLPPTAQLARDVARELLGLAYVSGEHAVDLVLGVDCSPSMRPWVAGGVLEATLEVFAGLASVIDPNGRIDAVLCGRSTRQLTPEAIDVFASVVTAAVRRQPLVTGLRSRALGSGKAGTLVYLVTDSMPADMTAEPGGAHLAVLTVAAPTLPAPRQSGPYSTMVPVERGPSSGVTWTRDDLRPIVASLLGAYERRPRGAA